MFRKISNTLLVILVYVASYLATTTSYFGNQMMDLSVVFPFQFMPPGVVFMIAWTLIYVLLAWFVVYMWRKVNADKNKNLLMLFALVNTLNVLWLDVTGQGRFLFSFVVLFALFMVLVRVLDILKAKGHTHNTHPGRITFGAYYGWVSIATFVLGVSQVLYLYYPSFALSQVWAAIAVVIGIFVLVISWLRWKNIYNLIFSLWGLGGALRARILGR